MGLRRDEVTGEWRKLHEEELYDMYSPNTVQFPTKKTGAVRINATLRVVRVTFIAV